MVDLDVRTGDVLRIRCPFTPAAVTGVSPWHVTLRWPWWRADPDVDWIAWNGDVAVARRYAGPDWDCELFRVTPEPDRLRVGDRCEVGIPPTIVHVIDVLRHDPPRETGWLPRPRRGLVVLRDDTSPSPAREEQGYEIDPDDDIPITIEVMYRPYAFLEPGDDVVDAAGRAWCFRGPSDWRPYDGAGGDAPTWPLALLAREPGRREPAAAVTAATATGSHALELARWRTPADTEPP